MLAAVIADFFKYKLLRSIIVLACWSQIDRVKFLRQLSKQGLSATISCNPDILESIHLLQGVLYFTEENNLLLDRVKPEHFSHNYKWMVVGDEMPNTLHHVRYDVDVVLLKTQPMTPKYTEDDTDYPTFNETLYIEDIMVHPRDGASEHAWAYWTKYSGLKVTHDRERTLRRRNFRNYPVRIAAPISNYSPKTYKGSFIDYMADTTMHDAGIRCGYTASELIIEALNATKVVQVTTTWLQKTNVSEAHTSMFMLLLTAQTELAAGALRPTYERISILDYITPIWLFSVGFTYLAERDSSSNMYIQPFDSSVWWSCLVIGFTLALAQRITASNSEEKAEAFMSVLATWLQQDANAVPTGIAGRWTFSVMSICSMLVHAYYTSAIVSALMSSGRGGPNTLKELGDSNYEIKSEYQDFMNSHFFNVTTKWYDMEYLKKKKSIKPSNVYLDIEHGVEKIKRGTLAYHAEYHQLYSHYKTFSDVELCKIKKIDTIPEKMSWVTAPHRGQFTDVMRSTGMWIHEIGLARRLILRTSVQPPRCRAAMLAERVTFTDIVPLLGVSISAGFLSMILLVLEIFCAKWKRSNKKNKGLRSHSSSPVPEDNMEEFPSITYTN
ncbi:uncharacterized protein LOC113521088 [Galleria mellonella]|uniref:Uncharacterized protein LOC113521088 n=1 Tax=Galleria mellonella TaxID=7137 RepID=A0ABM3MLE4_GALME|nr:uncharacterized protein LOC113521088 [Galleria mellonella]